MMIDEKFQMSGAILLPGVPVLVGSAMPLHIFEPRYRQMLKDAAEGKGMFVVGSLPTSEDGKISQEPIEMAVLVEIEVNQELPDGRSVLIVSAVESVKVESWEQGGLYPKAVYEVFKRDIPENAGTIESLLLDSFENLTNSLSEDNKKHLKSHISSQKSLEAIIDVIAQHVVTDESERRYFLEEPSDANRASKLLLLLEETVSV